MHTAYMLADHLELGLKPFAKSIRIDQSVKSRYRKHTV